MNQNSKKRRNISPESEIPEKKQFDETVESSEESISIEAVINDGIPHVGEQIFRYLKSDDLIRCLEVSTTWKVFAEKDLLKRWNGKMLEACQTGKAKIVELLLKHYTAEED